MPLPLRIELERAGIFIGNPYWDITATAFSMTIRRGRDDFTQPFDAGTVSIQFRNVDGFLDPDNTASSVYPSMSPGFEVRVIANAVDEDWETDPDARPLFVGRITDVVVNHDVIGESTITLTAADALSLFSQQQIVAGTSFVEESTTDRVVAVNSAPGVDVPTKREDLEYLLANSDGQSICAAETVGQINALQYLQRVALTEQGEFFIRNQGGLFLADRYWLLRPSQFTFTDTTGGTRFEAIERLSSWAQFYTRAQANRTGEDPVTRTTFTPFPLPQQLRFLELGEVLLRTDAEVADLIDFALVRTATPIPQIALLTVLLDDKPLSEQLGLLALELTDSVTVNYTPPGMSQLSLPSNIQSISHSYTVGLGWRVSFGFVPRDATNYLVLDDVTLGRLDENALAF